MGWPLMPPLALMSATYISSVFFSGSPRNEAGPVTDSTAPIFTSASAPPVAMKVARPNVAAMVRLAVRATVSSLGVLPSLFLLRERIALLDQTLELFGLLGDPVRVARFILRARARGGLLDELADVVTNDGDAVFQLGERQGHGFCPC